MIHGPVKEQPVACAPFGMVARGQQGDNHKVQVIPGSARPESERRGQQTGFTSQPQMMG